MTPGRRPSRLSAKDQVALGAALLAAVAGALIWMLWVVPIVSSVERAHPAPLGQTLSVDLDAGESSGVWASGISAALGTMRCRVTGPDGAEPRLLGAPSLNWDDTLWWMTPRAGFEQVLRFAASGSGVHRVSCTDSLDTYDGEFLLAGDTFGGSAIGLGRGTGFAVGTVLAFCAVVLPLFAVLLPIVIGLRLLFTRRRKPVGQSFQPARPLS